jgi:hypothetical protein
MVEWHVQISSLVEYQHIYPWYVPANPKYISMFQVLLAISESKPISMECEGEKGSSF